MSLKRVAKTLLAEAYANRSKIETVLGITCVVLGTGMLISKANKAAEISVELEERNKNIRRKDANEEWESKKERSHEVRDMLGYGVTGYAKTYAFPLFVETVGLGLIVLSDIHMNQEYAAVSALAASYAATLGTVKERVIADQGEEKWQDYLLGPQFTTVDVMPDGTIIQTTEPVDNPNRGANLPPHCFFFDEANPNWEKDPQMNRDFLEDHLRWLNQKLWAEGFLFENDIRRDIGAPLVKSGWTSGIFAEDKDGNRNYISFGLDAKNPAAQRFREGTEPSIVIQLNVEDNIIEQLRLPLI